MTVVRKIVKASELPPEWRKEFSDPTRSVRVVLQEIDPELETARTIEEIMAIASVRAQARGLTPEILEEILNER